VIFKHFTEFTQKYNKKYDTVESFERALTNFAKNFEEVVKADKFHGGHTKAITKFADLSKEEFKAKYLTLRVEPNGWCDQAKSLKFLGANPDSFDWREKAGVTPVKDQGQCGSCWAFSTVGHIESLYYIKNKKVATFSEQQLVDCDTDTDQGCNGGLMKAALTYVQNNGLESDKDYKYTARDGSCTAKKEKFQVSVQNIKCYEDMSDDDMMSALIKIGPLAIAVDATDFQMYDSGILDCNAYGLDHGVLLVGYGSEEGKDFWIVKNSWGANWGEKGFVRVNREASSNCMIGAYVTTADLK